MEHRKRHQVIAFRVTEAERRQINAKIRQSGQSQQEYLLRAALGQTIHVVEELKPVGAAGLRQKSEPTDRAGP